MTELVKQKRALENRVKYLEQTSMNWHFPKSQERPSKGGYQSSLGFLNDNKGSDYEPVRCNITVNEETTPLDIHKQHSGTASAKK